MHVITLKFTRILAPEVRIKYTGGPKIPLSMCRLNSGIKNRNNFFAWTIFLIQKIGTNSVIYADSGDIKTSVEFPGNSFLKIL